MKQVKLTLIVLLITFSSNQLNAQIDMTDLRNKLATYTMVDSSATAFSMHQKTFASPDSSEIYEVIFNANGIISNPLVYGNAISHVELDSKGRRLKSVPYRANGEASDFTTYQYVYFDSIRMTQINHLTYDGLQYSRLEKVFDDQKRLIEKRMFDENLKLEWSTIYKFDDEKHLRFEYSYDSLMQPYPSDCGVYIVVQRFPTSGFIDYWLDVLEVWYYDLEMNLVDCSKHNGYSGLDPYSRIKRTKVGNNIRETRWNSADEKVSDDLFERED